MFKMFKKEIKRTILFYPTIAIQNSNWIKQAIFYWDSISSIVPSEYRDRVYENDDIRKLIEHDAFWQFLAAFFQQNM